MPALHINDQRAKGIILLSLFFGDGCSSFILNNPLFIFNTVAILIRILKFVLALGVCPSKSLKVILDSLGAIFNHVSVLMNE